MMNAEVSVVTLHQQLHVATADQQVCQTHYTWRTHTAWTEGKQHHLHKLNSTDNFCVFVEKDEKEQHWLVHVRAAAVK